MDTLPMGMYEIRRHYLVILRERSDRRILSAAHPSCEDFIELHALIMERMPTHVAEYGNLMAEGKMELDYDLTEPITQMDFRATTIAMTLAFAEVFGSIVSVG